MAAKAKSRLKNGYWANIKKERVEAHIRAEEGGLKAETVNEYYRNRVTFEIKKENSPQNDELYKKVCNILDNGGDTINPIGQLIDREKYDALDEKSKQRYIMNLAAKYQELSKRYYQEKNIGKI